MIPVTRLDRYYFNFAQAVFFVYLLGMLSFGRAFAVLHLQWKTFPIFITEVVLLFLTPLLFIRWTEIRRIPKKFWLWGGMFFIMAVFYFVSALAGGKHFALRDVVYALYPLFIPFTVILLSREQNLRRFLFILIFANILAISLGRYIIFNQNYLPVAEGFIYSSRTFNLGLYFGLTSAALASLYIFNEQRLSPILKGALFFLVSLNIYMILIFGIRSAWMALLVMTIFIVGVTPRAAGKFLFRFLPCCLLLTLVFYYLDFKMVPSEKLPLCVAKYQGLKNYVKNRPQAMPLAADGVTLVVSSQTKDTVTLRKTETKAEPPVPQAAGSAESKNNEAADIRQAHDNIRWRMQIWQQTIEFARQSPVWGQGFGVYPHYNIWGNTGLEIRGFGADSGLLPAHNHLLTIFYKMGIVGILLFIVLNSFVFGFGIKSLVVSSSRKVKAVILAALSGLVYWHIMAFFFDVIDSPPTNIFFWILIGLVFAARALEEGKSEERTLL